LVRSPTIAKLPARASPLSQHGTAMLDCGVDVGSIRARSVVAARRLRPLPAVQAHANVAITAERGGPSAKIIAWNPSLSQPRKRKFPAAIPAAQA